MINILLINDKHEHVIDVWRTLRKNHIINPLPVVRNGAIALNMLRGTNGAMKMDPLPGIILLDINISGMNAFEFLENLKDDLALKSINVFVMINSEDDKELVKEYHQHISGYILKPVSLANFALAVSVLNHSWQLTALSQ